ncbi:hypothetical protein SUGI_0112420 [Cryptomeria japonica]|uniref:RING-H2 finger protein ATL64 n=1 Tax=Cryptomeria japonica TaxID=3369 RepID=UPI002408AC29|nr:RING-H2 finger protein ATL64 [Cryptomeria japonica]XP_059072844.1 RING-H2 finger protein ATL64-like [Cryptomeria japonica]GLJ09587.1 hypothetical protein SUGI_0112400 [Cryptomeria japonica]GLJ09589.1 hypothetical protein SUGI_0112420 [Cryptomeria japonica]
MATSLHPFSRRLNREEHYSSKTVTLVNSRLFIASAFIFTVIIFMAALATFILCFKRFCIRRLPLESDEISIGLPQKKSVTESFPVFVYERKNYKEQRLECAVCLSEFEEEEKGRILPVCNHSFHVDCIDRWFESQSTCPICRVNAQVDTLSAAVVMVDA